MAKMNITIVSGDTWTEPVRFRTPPPASEPVMFPNHDAVMQIRSMEGAYGITDEETLLVEASTTTDEIEWTSDDELVITLPPEVTRTLNPLNQRQIPATWGLSLTDRATGKVTTVLQGSVKILGRVVR